MIIADIPYLEQISTLHQIKGGEDLHIDNKAVAIAYSYADGLESLAVAGTLVYLDRGFSQAQSFSEAQSSSS